MNLWDSPAALKAAVDKHGQAAVNALPRFTRGRFKGLPKGILGKDGSLRVFGREEDPKPAGDATQAPPVPEPPAPSKEEPAQGWLLRNGGYEAVDEEGQTAADRRRARLVDEGRLSRDPQNIREKGQE